MELDLVLFKGDDFISRSIRCAEDLSRGNSDFSHCGIIITRRLLDIQELEPEKLYVLESTTARDPASVNVVTGKSKFGVQIREFEALKTSYLKEAGSKIAICKLKVNPFTINPEKTKKEFVKIYNKYANSLYELNIFALLGTFIPCMVRPRNFLDRMVVHGERILFKQMEFETVFCSELVTIIYTGLGMIGEIDPETIMPVDFLDSKRFPNLIDSPIYLK